VFEWCVHFGASDAPALHCTPQTRVGQVGALVYGRTSRLCLDLFIALFGARCRCAPMMNRGAKWSPSGAQVV